MNDELETCVDLLRDGVLVDVVSNCITIRTHGGETSVTFNGGLVPEVYYRLAPILTTNDDNAYDAKADLCLGIIAN